MLKIMKFYNFYFNVEYKKMFFKNKIIIVKMSKIQKMVFLMYFSNKEYNFR